MEERDVTNENEIVKKRGNGCLIAVLVVLGFIILLGVVGYWGYRRLTTAVSSRTDLGVEYSMADLEESFSSAGFTGGMCLDCAKPVYSDPHEVEVSFSSAQASAWINYANNDIPYGELSDLQVKFSEDRAEISALFEYEGKVYPVYISGTGSKATEKSITGSLDSLRVSGVSLPSYVTPMVESLVLGWANEKLGNMGDTLRIDSLELTENGLEFKGLAPSRVE